MNCFRNIWFGVYKFWWAFCKSKTIILPNRPIIWHFTWMLMKWYMIYQYNLNQYFCIEVWKWKSVSIKAGWCIRMLTSTYCWYFIFVIYFWISWFSSFSIISSHDRSIIQLPNDISIFVQKIKVKFRILKWYQLYLVSYYPPQRKEMNIPGETMNLRNHRCRRVQPGHSRWHRCHFKYE